MLGLGVKVLGIGKLVLDNGVIRIEPPNDGRTYYLTTQSKSEVLKGVKSTYVDACLGEEDHSLCTWNQF